MAAILTRGLREREEAESDVVAIAWEVVRGAASGRRPEDPKAVVNAIWTEVRRSGGLRRRGELEVVPLRGVDG